MNGEKMEKKIAFAIAEDEAIEREAMQKFIRETFPQADVIWMAQDGREALEKIEKKEPDILIIDIEMPVMNGLRLCEILYQKQFSGVMLIHTAYAKFSYARKAVTLNVYDYILKPVDPANLKETLERCIEEWKRKEEARKKKRDMEELVRDVRQYALSLLVLDTADARQIDHFFRTVNWPEDQKLSTWVLKFTSLTAFKPLWMKHFEESIRMLRKGGFLISSEYIDEGHCLMIMQPEQRMDPEQLYTLIYVIAHLGMKESNHMETISEGPCDNYAEIVCACRKVVRASDGKTLAGNIRMPARTWQLLTRKELEKISGRLNRYLRDGTSDQVRRYLKRIQENFPGSEENVFWELVPVLLETMEDIWPEQNYSEKFCELFLKKQKIDIWLDELIKPLEAALGTRNSGALEDVLEWIKKNPTEHITLSEAAARMGMDSSYFSRYFKKIKGQNFSDMLTSIRLKYAEKLLHENPGITLGELASSCGFSSKTYFCEVFRKRNGMSVSQYLQVLQEEEER